MNFIVLVVFDWDKEKVLLMKKLFIILICLMGLLFIYKNYSENKLVTEVESYLVNEKGYSKGSFKSSYFLDTSLKGNRAKQVKVIFKDHKRYEFYFYIENKEIILLGIQDDNTNSFVSKVKGFDF